MEVKPEQETDVQVVEDKEEKSIRGDSWRELQSTLRDFISLPGLNFLIDELN